MILVRESWWADETSPNGKLITLPKILIPNTEKFKEVINLIDIKSFYRKMMIKEGSVVRLSDDYEYYYFGYDDKYEKGILGSTQTIAFVENDGEVVFENPNNETYLNRNYTSYGVTEIIETIKY